jgi:GH43 family beta-xylosidase
MPKGIEMGRREVIAGGAAMPIAAALRARVSVPANPLVLQRADPQILRKGNDYYFTASVPEYDRLVLRRASTIAGLADAPESVIWRRPAEGRMAGYIWAPEIHWFDGRWQIYFAAGDGDRKFRIRTYVLQTAGRDPLAAEWTLLGQLETPWDSFTLDSTVFEHRGVRYIAWAQAEPGIATNSNLYLAPLKTATTLAAAPARLSVPEFDWEVQGFKVNEGPAILARHGKLFMTYSASATDARYCMGMLAADADADIMDPASWTKSPVPVFVSSEANKVYGPGHNSFVVDEQGSDLLVYHGRDYREIKGDPLFDPNRHTRVQPIRYRPDGMPDFGVPVANGPVRG